MKFHPFQTQDLARFALHDGGIFSGDTGYGKTLCAFTYPLLKVGYKRLHANSPRGCALPPIVPVAGDRLVPDRPVLLVVPGDLHQQTAQEGADKFHVEVVPLDHQDTFMQLSRGADATTRRTADGRPVIPPGFYITSYTQLCCNGREPMPDPLKMDPRAMLAWSCVKEELTADSFQPSAKPLTRPSATLSPSDGERGRGEGQSLETSNLKLEPLSSIVGFYALRGTEWASAYSRLAVNPLTSTLADMEGNYTTERDELERQLSRLGNSRHEDGVRKHLKNQLRALDEAAEVLRHILPHQLPGEALSPQPSAISTQLSAGPLTRPSATLSPSDGERDRGEGQPSTTRPSATLSPSDGERDGERGNSQLSTFISQHTSFYHSLSTRQQDWVIREFFIRWVQACAYGVGQKRPAKSAKRESRTENREADATTAAPLETSNLKLETPPVFKCLYQPTLADHCYNAFDVIVVDEGVRMKGEDTLIGMGVRQMEAPYRMVLTATPVKNRLPDIFRLAWWASGGLAKAHARWPYDDDPEARGEFASTFMVSERNLTKEAKAEAIAEATGERVSKARFTKLTPEVCRVHMLWKLLAPLVLRRRKADFGIEIVPRVRHVIRCPMGAQQFKVYGYHVSEKVPYVDKNGEPALGARLQALRVAAADPTSPLLVDHGELWEEVKEAKAESGKQKAEMEQAAPQSAIRNPQSSTRPKVLVPFRSKSPWVPKVAATLKLVEEIVGRGEQVLIGAAFHDPLDTLSKLLAEAGVRNVVLDGRTSQKQRGLKVARFKSGRSSTEVEPVALAGVESMSDGHNLYKCNNVILIAFSWAFDKFKQFLDRVHRVNSEKPVNVYLVLCDGTIDARLESLVNDKADAQELVLDGRLIGDRPEEVSLAQLLSIAQSEFASAEGAVTVPEETIAAQWPALRDRLRAAQAKWDQGLKAECRMKNEELRIKKTTPAPAHPTQSAIHNPQSAIRNPQSAIRNPQSAIPLKPSIQDRIKMILNIKYSPSSATPVPVVVPVTATSQPEQAPPPPEVVATVITAPPATETWKERLARRQALAAHLTKNPGIWGKL